VRQAHASQGDPVQGRQGFQLRPGIFSLPFHCDVDIWGSYPYFILFCDLFVHKILIDVISNSLKTGKASLRQQAGRIWRSDQARVSQEGEDYQEDHP
jgi:hypothetical protein